jgi:hypothetical protein
MTPDEAREGSPDIDAAARRVGHYLEAFGDGVIGEIDGKVLHARDLAVLIDPEGNGPDWPTCDTCGHEHPIEPSDPGAFAERYIERHRAEDGLSRTDTEAVLMWARCIVGRHRNTALEKIDLEYQCRDLRLENEQLNLKILGLRATTKPAPQPADDTTTAIQFGVRDRHGRITERPTLEAAVAQYDNMLHQAHALGLTPQDLGAAVVEREVLTVHKPWRPVEFEHCPDCGGSGGYGEEPCNTCGGNYRGQIQPDDPWAAVSTLTEPPPSWTDPGEPPF